MIHIEEINETNWKCNLSVTEEQLAYVSDKNAICARAYAYRNFRSCAFLIYNDDTPVGVGLYYDCPKLDAYDFSQIFIDKRYQHQGYGREAIRLVLDEMKKDGKYNKVVLCYIEGNEAARSVYENFGFVEMDRDEDEIIMECIL